MVRFKELYASLVQVSCFFLLSLQGCTLIAVRLSPKFRYFCSRLLFEGPGYSLYSAFFLFLLAFSMLFVFSYKKQIRFLMAPHSVDIDRDVIYKYVEQFWKEEFPEEVHSFEIYILPDNILEIAVQLRKVDPESRKQFLERSECGLGKILASFLDYHQRFYITMQIT